MQQNAKAIQALVNEGRSPTELIVKTVAIHFACLVAVAHLGSLRRLPLRVQIYECVAFIFIPLLPCAQIFIGISQAVPKYRSRGYSNPFGWRHYICAALGMHVVPEEEEVAAFPLLNGEPGRPLGQDVLACDSKEASKTRWLLRMIPLILLIGEASWGSFLWVRRIRFEKYIAPTFPTPFCGDYACDIVLYADSFLDHLNAAAVIGGFCTAVGSLAIHSLNCSWTCSRRIAREATGPSQDRATQRVTGEILRLFSEARSYEMLLASFMQTAAEYRVLELFWVPAIMDMLRDALRDDTLPLVLFLTLWNSIVCFLIPLAMFVMSFMFLFHIKLPRGLEKLIQSDARSYLPG